MKKALILICLFLTQLLFSAYTTAEIYRWKGPNGKVHLSDRAQSPSAETITLKPVISEEKVEAARQKSRKFVNRQRHKANFEKEENTKAASKVRKEALSTAKKANYCGKAKRELRILKAGVPVYRADKAGKRRYLEDLQRAAEIKQWNKNISRYCR